MIRQRSPRRQRRGEPHTEHGLRVLLVFRLRAISSCLDCSPMPPQVGLYIHTHTPDAQSFYFCMDLLLTKQPETFCRFWCSRFPELPVLVRVFFVKPSYHTTHTTKAERRAEKQRQRRGASSGQKTRRGLEGEDPFLGGGGGATHSPRVILFPSIAVYHCSHTPHARPLLLLYCTHLPATKQPETFCRFWCSRFPELPVLVRIYI